MARDQEKSGSDEAVAGKGFAAVPPERRARFSELLLLATGLFQFLTGAALIAVPSALPQYTWVVQGLARRGITGLPLYVGGVVLTGLWLSTRSSRAGAKSARESAVAAGAAIERLTSELGHLGDGLQGLRIEFVYLKDALQSQIQRAEANAKSSTDNPSDAVYRLAASLDQLGARIEERLNANHRELGQNLQAVSSAVETIKTLATAPPPQVEEADEPVPEAISIKAEKAHVASDHDEIEGAAGTDGWDHEHAERSSRLGLLDMLDDLGRILPRKTSPVLERPSIHTDPFEDVQDEGWKHAASIPAPMPAPRTGLELQVQSTGELLGSGSRRSDGDLEELPIGDKLEELRSLLADARVREALASIERSRR